MVDIGVASAWKLPDHIGMDRVDLAGGIGDWVVPEFYSWLVAYGSHGR